jgi:hypothetical protein
MELLGVTEPATILVPTDMAWMAWVNAAPDDSTATQTQLAYINIAIVSYHEIPKVTVLSADMRDGMSLGPTNLPDSGSITVHIAPNTHVIRFTGFDRQGSTARYATLLYPDIKVLGGNGVVMHVCYQACAWFESWQPGKPACWWLPMTWLHVVQVVSRVVPPD